MVAGGVATLGMIGLAIGEIGYREMLSEDGAIEWASAAFFASAAVGAAVRLRRRAGDGWLPLCVGALAILCFLSELSFGARLFGWDMPDMRGGGELDGAHDLVLLAWRAVSETPLRLATAAVAAITTLGLGPWAAQRAGITLQATGRWLAAERGRALAATASVALAVALACDLLEQPRLNLVEEPVEMLAAILLALSMWTSRGSDAPAPGPSPIAETS